MNIIQKDSTLHTIHYLLSGPSTWSSKSQEFLSSLLIAHSYKCQSSYVLQFHQKECVKWKFEGKV
jgi:hypothetical protein